MERYRKTIRWVLLLILLFGCSYPGIALHEYYEQNGDCYVLVGDGPQCAVYSLNNLETPHPGVASLWNLEWDNASQSAYGITAHQTWTASTSQKRIYVFAGADTGLASYSGLTSRRVIVTPTPNAPVPTDIDYEPTTIVHRYHNQPGDSPTGAGNHTTTDYCTSLTNIFGGTCYPCSVIPDADPSNPGYYLVPAGQWYHSLDHPVRSPYVYGWENYTTPGYWVHYVCRENVSVNERDLKLHCINRNTSTVNPSGYPQDIAIVRLGEIGTMDQRGECVDGCITAVDDIELPPKDVPILDCAYSSIGKSYLYQREPHAASYSLQGVDGNSHVVGDPGDLTTRFIGVSSKDFAGDYVYALGTATVQGWLDDANMDMTISGLQDIAVSDQWWQTGGIVYAFDKENDLVFQFVRDETSSSPTVPLPISLASMPFKVDSISADGFGHLYMIRTQIEPMDHTTFTADDAYTYVGPTWVGGAGDKKYTAHFKQGFFKTVFKRNYYNRNVDPISGRIWIGDNRYTREFYVASSADVIDRTSWALFGGFTKLTTDPNDNYYVEVAVINSATPPEVTGNRDGLCDMNGPMVSDFLAGTIDFATPIDPLDTSFYKVYEEGVYTFLVENFPTFDAHGVNITVDAPDKDGDGRQGSFVSTIDKSSVKYYWKLIQEYNAASEPVSLADGLMFDSTLVSPGYGSSPVYSNYFTPGQYKIGVKTTFRWYDYDQLAPGSLAASRSIALQPERTAVGEDADNYSWAYFTVVGGNPPPPGSGGAILLSGIPATGTLDPATFYYEPMAVDPVTIPSFVIPDLVGCMADLADGATWSFAMRESHEYIASWGMDRLASMAYPTPPLPSGTAQVFPDSVRWTAPAVFTWQSLLTRNSEEIFNRVVTTSVATLTPDQVRYLFPVPSQPEGYSLTCTGFRQGQADVWIITGWHPPDANGIEYPIKTLSTGFPLNIEMTAAANIIVKDRVGPMETLPDPVDPTLLAKGVFNKDTFIFGTTGETLAQVEGKTNPDYLEFVVADNNPFGNAETGTFLDFADPYHSNKGLDLTVNHNFTTRFGRIRFTNQLPITKTNTACRSDPDQVNTNVNYDVFQGDVAYTDFGGVDLPWLSAADARKAFSYRKYTMKVASVGFFLDNGQPELNYTYANNSTGYVNPFFGLITRDAANNQSATDSLLMPGQLVIRDNDRPNMFLQVRDLKYNAPIWLPTNFVPEVYGDWRCLSTTDKNNGLDVWNAPVSPGIGSIHSSHKSDAVLTRFLTFGGDNVLEVGVPFFASHHVVDNIGDCQVTLFELRGMDNAIPGDWESSGDDTISYIFRKATTATNRYKIKLKAQDNALDWPSDNNDPTAASPRPNEREMECDLTVYDSGLDIRVIDRSHQRR